MDIQTGLLSGHQTFIIFCFHWIWLLFYWITFLACESLLPSPWERQKSGWVQIIFRSSHVYMALALCVNSSDQFWSHGASSRQEKLSFLRWERQHELCSAVKMEAFFAEVRNQSIEKPAVVFCVCLGMFGLHFRWGRIKVGSLLGGVSFIQNLFGVWVPWPKFSCLCSVQRPVEYKHCVWPNAKNTIWVTLKLILLM